MSHSHDHNHDHAHGRDDGPTGGAEMQAANRSLADALRVSFGLLAVLMVVLLAALLLTGLRTVQSNQRGVKLVFGRIVGEGDARVLGEGLHWSWPEPIGRVLTVATDEQKLEMNDFWLFVAPGDAAKPLSDLRPASEGLRPLLDGALLTGDRYLLHAKFVVLYRCGVAQMKDEAGIPLRGQGRPDATAVLNYFLNVARPEERRPPPTKPDPKMEDVQPAVARELVRTAVANAAIRTAAGRTLDSIYTGDKDAFIDAIIRQAQKMLEETMHAGIFISRIELPEVAVPLRARGAFNAVNEARQAWESQISQAKSDAVTQIQGAAGEASSLLVGDVVSGIGATTAPAGRPEADELKAVEPVKLVQRWVAAQGGDDASAALALRRQIEHYGLLNLYAHARENKDPDAEVILAEINRLLNGDEAGGDVATILGQAKSYETTIRQTVAARADEFNRLVDKYEATPRMMIERLWAQTKEDVLSRPNVEKFYVSRTERLVLQINRDPEQRRKMLLRALQGMRQPGPTAEGAGR